MITIYNQTSIDSESSIFSAHHPIFDSGQYVFQNLIIKDATILFWEESYFNLMAGMRKLRLSIPMEFTADFFEKQITPSLENHKTYPAQICVFPEGEKTSYLIKIENANTELFSNHTKYEIDVYKDIAVYSSLLSSINTFKPENAMANAYCKENDLDDVIFLNNSKNVARTKVGNIYYFQNDNLYTNAVENGAYRQAIDKVLSTKKEVVVQEFSAFMLQKADEVFITSDAKGIISISKFRKKSYSDTKTQALISDLIQ